MSKKHSINQNPPTTIIEENDNKQTSENQIYNCGSIAIIGKPNTGKSTLLNALVGQKISITSRKAQTTRHRIMGILTQLDAQYIFVDTPGFQTKHRNALNRKLNKTVNSTLNDVDVIIMLVQAHQFFEEDANIIKLLPMPTIPTNIYNSENDNINNDANKLNNYNYNCPVILVCNKLDTISFEDKPKLLPFLKNMQQQFPFKEIVPMSAKNPKDIERLLSIIKPYLPQQQAIYNQDDLTDKSQRFLASELIREKVFRFTGDELPYQSTVIIDKFEEGKKLDRIFATILVDKPAHKAMVIGHKGEKLKQIGMEARQDMEKLFNKKVYLELWVKVKGGWADNEAGLKAYGYE